MSGRETLEWLSGGACFKTAGLHPNDWTRSSNVKNMLAYQALS